MHFLNCVGWCGWKQLSGGPVTWFEQSRTHPAASLPRTRRPTPGSPGSGLARAGIPEAATRERNASRWGNRSPRDPFIFSAESASPLGGNLSSLLKTDKLGLNFFLIKKLYLNSLYALPEAGLELREPDAPRLPRYPWATRAPRDALLQPRSRDALFFSRLTKGEEKSRESLGLSRLRSQAGSRPGRGTTRDSPNRTATKPPTAGAPVRCARGSAAEPSSGRAPEFRRVARSSAPVPGRLRSHPAPARDRGRTRTLGRGPGGRPPGREARRSGRAGPRRPERRLRDGGDRRAERETPGLIRTRARHAPSRWPGRVSSFADLGAGTR